MSVFKSDQQAADFAAEMGFVLKSGFGDDAYYGVGMSDYSYDDLFDSPELMVMLMSRWTVGNFLGMFDDIDEADRKDMMTPGVVIRAILEEEFLVYKDLIKGS